MLLGAMTLALESLLHLHLSTSPPALSLTAHPTPFSQCPSGDLAFLSLSLNSLPASTVWQSPLRKPPYPCLPHRGQAINNLFSLLLCELYCLYPVSPPLTEGTGSRPSLPLPVINLSAPPHCPPRDFSQAWQVLSPRLPPPFPAVSSSFLQGL